MTASAPTFAASAPSADLPGVSTGLGGTNSAEPSGDVFGQIFARLLQTSETPVSLPVPSDLDLPSLASPTLLAGGQPIPTTLPSTAVPKGSNITGVTPSLTGDQIPTFESIQAFSTALAAFLATAPAEGVKTLPAEASETLPEIADDSPDPLLQLLDLLTPVYSEQANAATPVLPSEISVSLNSNLAAGPIAPTPVDPRLTRSSVGNETESVPLKGRLQPFQPGLFGPARRVGEDVSGKLEARNLALDGNLVGTPSLESILGGSRTNRIVVDKSILKQVDKLLGRTPTVDLVAERGASILTPEELKPSAASVEDRNATALARVDRSEFVNRVVQALERAHAERPMRIEVEIQPPALGKLKVQVIERNGELTARIEVQSSTTRSLLVDNLPTLDRNLGEHGVQIQRFQVDQTNTGYSNLGEQPRDAPQQNLTGQDQRQGHRQPDFFEPVDDDSERGPPISLAELLGLVDGMDRVI